MPDIDVLDEPSLPAGDRGAPLGMVTKDRPSWLPEGAWAYLKNADIEDPTSIQRRRGKTIPTFSETPVPAIGYPISAACEYVVSGEKRIVVAYQDTDEDEGVLAEWIPGNDWAELDRGTIDLVDVELEVAGGKVFVLTGGPVYSWDGSTFTLENGTPAVTEDPPDAEFGTNFAGIMFLAGVDGNRDKVYYSLALEYGAGKYNRDTNWFAFRHGSTEEVVGMIGMRQNELFVFCSSSTHILFTQGDPDSWFQKVVDPEIGCSARRSIMAVGEDVFFLDQFGQLRSIGRTIQDAAQGTAKVPISDPIYPTFDDYSKTNIAKAEGILFKSKYVLSMATGGATNDTVWTMETRRGAWALIDGWDVNCLVISDCETPAAYNLYGFDTEDGQIYQLFDGYADQQRDEEGDVEDIPIAFRCVSRGYNHGIPTQNKLFVEGEVAASILRDFDAIQTGTIFGIIDEGREFETERVGLSLTPEPFFPMVFPLEFVGESVFRMKFHVSSINKGRSFQVAIEFLEDNSDIRIRDVAVFAKLDNYDSEI